MQQESLERHKLEKECGDSAHEDEHAWRLRGKKEVGRTQDGRWQRQRIRRRRRRRSRIFKNTAMLRECTLFDFQIPTKAIIDRRTSRLSLRSCKVELQSMCLMLQAASNHCLAYVFSLNNSPSLPVVLAPYTLPGTLACLSCLAYLVCLACLQCLAFMIYWAYHKPNMQMTQRRYLKSRLSSCNDQSTSPWDQTFSATPSTNQPCRADVTSKLL